MLLFFLHLRSQLGSGSKKGLVFGFKLQIPTGSLPKALVFFAFRPWGLLGILYAYLIKFLEILLRISGW